jgi:hypothetical protein
VKLPENHPIRWTQPQPLWDANPEPARFQRPAILRFASDAFMEEFLGVLATDPHRLREYEAVPETWRGVLRPKPATLPKPAFARTLQRLGANRLRALDIADPAHGKKLLPVEPPPPLLKLYQPAHQRFYLVTACLTCATAGMPDRKVDGGKQEIAGFVVRRLLGPKDSNGIPLPFDAATWREHAWVEQGGKRVWEQTANAGELSKTEEVLPLFPSNFQQDDERTRRLLASLIPVGRREAYLAAAGGSVGATGGVTEITARKVLLRTSVIEPWKALIAQAERTSTMLNEAGPTASDRVSARLQLIEISHLILVDLATFLFTHLRDVWNALLTNGTSPHASALAALRSVRVRRVNDGTTASSAGSPWGVSGAAWGTVVTTLADAMIALVPASVTDNPERDPAKSAVVKALESSQVPYSKDSAGHPSFVFPLADLNEVSGAGTVRFFALPDNIATDPADAEELNLFGDSNPEVSPAELLDKLTVVMARALSGPAPGPDPQLPGGAEQPADALNGVFVIRCLYQRPACGPLHADVVSEPTEPFEMASFFDPDAPVRPVRIGLPIDTTPAGLRKFNKNTMLVLSDTLCGQFKKLRGITFGDLVRAAIPGPLHKDLNIGEMAPCKKPGGNLSLGMICSISIPIVTLCALILLMIMVSILDFVFRWMPFFINCFPIPGMSGKPKSPAP